MNEVMSSTDDVVETDSSSEGVACPSSDGVAAPSSDGVTVPLSLRDEGGFFVSSIASAGGVVVSSDDVTALSTLWIGGGTCLWQNFSSFLRP